MKNYQIIEFTRLMKEFTICRQLKYTGQLNVKNKLREWNFYYQNGEIVWVTGGTHPHRRWFRNIAQNFPEIDIKNIQYSMENILVEYWDYLLLENLCLRCKSQQEQIYNILQDIISEILFDILQQINVSALSFTRDDQIILKSSLISINGNLILKQTQDIWQEWKKAGLENISPYFAPVLKQPMMLEQIVSPLVYKNFIKFINGKNSLLDLSLKMNKTVLQISRSLMPYIRQGIIKLVELQDLPLPNNKINNTAQFLETKKSNTPLVACIDDSPQICQAVDRIVTSNGMQFIGIQHPVQALPILMENKPDLIFLDLIMPVVSGYEVCEQLRRCSYFQKTPIVILTSSDGTFDRVRSKVFGATEFVNKPVENHKIMEVVHKYLQIELKTNSSPNLAFSF